MTNNELGDRLRNQREAIRPEISVRTLAKKAQMNPLTITNIETGFSPNPGVKTVEKIQTALAFFENQKGS